MPKRAFLYGSKAALVVLEGVALLAGALLVAGVVLTGRLATGPLDIGFAKTHIEQALYDPVSGYSVTLGSVVLEWPHLRGPLRMDLKDVGLVQKNRSVLTIGRVQLWLSGRQLFVGHIAPVRITLSEPFLHLIRTDKNQIQLSLESEAAPAMPQAPEESNPFMQVVEMLAKPQEEVDPRSPLGHLHMLEITDARMVMEDHVLGVTWYLPHLDLLFTRNRFGLDLSAGLDIPGGRNQASTIRIDADYNREQKSFHAALHLQDFDPLVLAGKIGGLSWLDGQDLSVDGDVNATIDSSLILQAASVDLAAEQGVLSIPQLYGDKPLPFKALTLKGAYDHAASTAQVDALTLEAGGATFTLSGTAALSPDEMKMPVTIAVPELTPEEIKALWPELLRGTTSEGWLTQKLSGGAIRDIKVSFNAAASRQADGSWQTPVTDAAADFAVKDMTVDYRAPLEPVEHAEGHGHFDGDKDMLEIAAESGEVGDMKLSGGKVLIDHLLGADVGKAVITAHLDAALPSVFHYIAAEPIDMSAQKLGLQTDGLAGKAALDLSVSFPTEHDLPADHVKVGVRGSLSDVTLPRIIHGMDLTGGPLALDVSGGIVKLKGKARLAGQDIALDWQQYLDSKGKPFRSHVAADLDVSKGVRDKLGLDLSDWLDGDAMAHVDYTEYADDRAQAQIDASLDTAILTISPFAYQKASGLPARVRCVALMQGGAVQEVKDLSVTAPDLKIDGGELLFAAGKQGPVMRSGALASVKLGQTDVGLRFEKDPGGLLKMELKGPFLDARPFLAHKNDKAPYSGPPLQVSVDAAQMRTGDGDRILGGAKAYLDLDTNGLPNQMELDARAGQGTIYLRLKPDASTGLMNFRLEATDAGALLHDFGISEKVAGGKLVAAGASKDSTDRWTIYGTEQLQDFHAIKAPALAQIGNSISPSGLQQLVNNEGIHFARLESQFEWHMRRPGDIFVFKDGRTSGSSLGLTFAGKVDQEKNAIDLNGEVVPASEINGLLGSVPVIGTLLGGKGGGIFAATYSVTGPLNDPKTSVNPLSVLTPGILRKIFFKGG